MIKRAQKQFIGFTALILLLVFACLYGISCWIMKNANVTSLMKILQELEYNYTIDSRIAPPDNGLIVEIKGDLSSASPIYEERHDKDAFIQTNVDYLVKAIASRDYVNVGSIDNVVYKVVNKDQQTIIFAIDGTFMAENFNYNVIRILITLSVIYVLLVVCVGLYSIVVFKPIKDSFIKQKQFISDAGHELKTPITVINANAEIIKQDTPSQWINNVTEQTDRLSTLVSDMLTLAKMEEDKVDYIKTNVNLSELILESTLPFEAVAFENGKIITTDLTANVNLFANTKHLKQIVNILLDNAVKHSKEKSEIVVSLKKDGNRAIFSVFNQGSLVPNGQEAQMFERFYRADQSRSRDSGGCGLGLSIAKSIANVNKWKIYASSEYQKSMCITVVF
jgi:signal transduction histidine kinase